MDSVEPELLSVLLNAAFLFKDELVFAKVCKARVWRSVGPIKVDAVVQSLPLTNFLGKQTGHGRWQADC